MNDLFGKTLRALMDGAEVKERALAEALSYDTTYISKWLNGSKLPSPRNAESVIRQIAGFLVRRQGGDESREQELFHTLKTAYDRDSSYISLISYCTDQGVGATSYYYIGKVGVSNSLSNGRPAILFGWLTSNPSPASVSTDSTKGKVFHAVTAYGTNGNYFICHYGWSGYSHVLLDGGLVGSCTLFQLN